MEFLCSVDALILRGSKTVTGTWSYLQESSACSYKITQSSSVLTTAGDGVQIWEGSFTKKETVIKDRMTLVVSAAVAGLTHISGYGVCDGGEKYIVCGAIENASNGRRRVHLVKFRYGGSSIIFQSLAAGLPLYF